MPRNTPRKKQLPSRKPRARLESPRPESIITIEEYQETNSPGLDPSVASTVEFFTKRLIEPSDEPAYEIKSLLEQSLTGTTLEHCSAILELHSMAVQCIKALDILAVKRPDLLRLIASKKTMWPTLYSHSPLHAPALKERLAAIGFATEAGMTWIKVDDVSKNLSQSLLESPKGLAILLINSIHSFRTACIAAERVTSMFKEIFSKKPDPDKIYQEYRRNTIRCAITVIASKHLVVFPQYTFALVEDCVRLPSYSSEKSVTDAWWDVGYQLLMLNTDRRPEKVPQFYELGRCRERHVSGFNATLKHEYYKPEAVKSNVRAKILTDLKEEFGRLARQLAKTEMAANSDSEKDKNL